MNLAIVITTIQPPTPPVLDWAKAAATHGARLIVVGDAKGPSAYLDDCDFWPLARQQGSPLGDWLPLNHYARKNLGYLAAIRAGANVVYETDDDNMPAPAWHPRAETVSAHLIPPRGGWRNVYAWFTAHRVWPRGLPLTAIDRAPYPAEAKSGIWSPVQQGLADGAPDVDAIWRLATGAPPVTFNRCASVALAQGTWCPINSQNTWWWPAAFPLLYLPVHCPSRVTDIWRGLIAQRCLWAAGGVVTFHGADVVQERNPHDLSRDFDEELPLLQNRELRPLLEDVEMGGDVRENLRRCYCAMVERGYLPSDELVGVDLWLESLP